MSPRYRRAASAGVSLLLGLNLDMRQQCDSPRAEVIMMLSFSIMSFLGQYYTRDNTLLAYNYVMKYIRDLPRTKSDHNAYMLFRSSDRSCARTATFTHIMVLKSLEN